MTAFMIHFLLSNVLICGMILFLLAVKRIFKKSLSIKMQYHLWFLLPFLLVLPFLQADSVSLPWEISALSASAMRQDTVSAAPVSAPVNAAADWINDFSVSVSGQSSMFGNILFFLWIAGIIVMLAFTIKSLMALFTLQTSALPLQNEAVRRIFSSCLKEMEITKEIRLYSTAYLSSPVMMGLFKPAIYLPIRLISDCDGSAMRCILLHELQHYKHKDTLINCFLIPVRVLYWFNPLVWYALREMKNDREIACDSAVLDKIGDSSRITYGETLLDLHEKLSAFSFSLAFGLSENKKQTARRIFAIASYQKPSVKTKIKSTVIFLLTAILFGSFAPALSVSAADYDHYSFTVPSEKICYTDLSSYYNHYDGSFVLYDITEGQWQIYNISEATVRRSPDSTYKIYDALFALEEGVITPSDSLLAWDKNIYPFEEWNHDQTLDSAMASSVNWYFNALDQELGRSALQSCFHEISYGNELVTGDLSSYWLESTLKISPVEQVELLTRFYENDFGYAAENIQAVKQSLLLDSSDSGCLYGKTGTGKINGTCQNGWFVGFVEEADHTCVFATNINSADNATGSAAADITLSVLSDLGIWQA